MGFHRLDLYPLLFSFQAVIYEAFWYLIFVVMVKPVKRNTYRIKKDGGVVGDPKDPKKPDSWAETLNSFVSNVYNWKENLSKNLTPYGYGEPIRRLYEGVVLNKKDPGRVRIEGQSGPPATSAAAERIDLLNMTLGEDQKYGSILESQYRPTEATDSDAVYYRSLSTEKSLRRALMEEGENNLLHNFISDPQSKRFSARQGGVLGDYKVSKGEDEKGSYISYYDKWDLNPLTSDTTGWKRELSDKVQSIAGVKSNELYGRIYYDPETGRPIEEAEEGEQTPSSSPDMAKIMQQAIEKKSNGGSVRLLKK
tara:strand:+ start:190 stop:1116 length:927 start_codon:yes stop_codon:yes gene_type:complete